MPKPMRQFTGPWAICGRCRGDGGHSHRLGAISADEMQRDWDEESIQRYVSGAYDEPCEECDGTGKVREPGTDEERNLLEEALKDDREVDSEERYMRRLEAHANGEF